ncbi:DinB family protein [Segetibacter aerophilus]|uniref:DNA damage-inducible protein DinB n=1 Tax=Segetibacter aerophilus TaxID=670293 RepID=A0A512BFG6_9BACT|nr:DinB family protein [Segetibacter aerophilus]GEO10706.1 DNA damage-inducible protein DinB [Segetibacter aerophilus]
MYTATTDQIASVITSQELLAHWQGHRKLTRKLIEAFPEKEFFEYSIGGMRPFAAMIKELLAIAVPGIREIVRGATEQLDEDLKEVNSKAKVLSLWDKSTEELNNYWSQLSDERFHETILAFGKYEGTVYSSILYFIDNEIHHRGQAYVYLRSLGIEPPAFWDR